MQTIFVTGIKKKTGKTLLCAGLAATMQGLSYSVSYYKPIETGAKTFQGILQSQDLQLIKYVDSNIKVSSSYTFPSYLSPIVSAYEYHSKISFSKIIEDFELNSQMCECHIIEGSNSLATPIDDCHTEIDLVKKLGANLIVVINTKISTIDETITFLNFVKNSKVKCNGIILTDYDMDSESLEEKYFPQLVKKFTGFDTLGILPHYKNIGSLTPGILISDTITNVNVEKIFNTKIHKLSQLL